MSPYGLKSSCSAGREREEETCEVRTAFQVDKERIIYSNAFRRLKYKTQVFLAPLGDHYRTRLTHTLEVSTIARAACRALRLNEDLAEAIALGHDLGHTPFGHSGEAVLKEIFGSGFCHSRQSLRVVEVLEKQGQGLNLTLEVRDGILKHSKGFGEIIPTDGRDEAVTVEGRIVRIADLMAYLNHDLDDAVRSGVIKKDQIPESCVQVLGSVHSERARTMINSLIRCSGPVSGSFVLGLEDEVHRAMLDLRSFLYENVYRSDAVHREFVKAKRIIAGLFDYFGAHPRRLNQRLSNLELAPWDGDPGSLERVVCDLVASMTDRYAMDLYSRLFLPRPQV